MEASTTTAAIRVEEAEGVARITLDRPPLNVLNLSMLAELRDALGAVRGARALVLTGEGRAFCAGVDVGDHTGERVAVMLRRFHDVVDRLLSFDGPVVAQVNGAALGGGCELLLACDVVFAREGAKLGQPEVRLGVFPPVAVALLPALIGRQRAMDLLLSGRTIEAAEAAAMGLVQHVVPAERLDTDVRAYVAGLAGLSPAVLRLTKRSTLSDRTRMRAAIDTAERVYLDELMTLSDAHEGLAAFLQKRPPVWTGA